MEKTYKRVPFDIELAKKIQSGEVDGKIKTRDGEHEMEIVCFSSTVKYGEKIQPIIAQYIDCWDCIHIRSYFEDGHYLDQERNDEDLVLEVPDNEPQFKPFDKVLVRNRENQAWRCDIFSHKSLYNQEEFRCIGNVWAQCIPYNEETAHLVGTTNNPKEE